MVELTKQLIQEFPAVLFLNGTLTMPGSESSAGVIQALSNAGLAFKAVDCSDEQYNPGVRAAVEELVGESALPQLFAGGQRVGGGDAIQELQADGRLRQQLMAVGAVLGE